MPSSRYVQPISFTLDATGHAVFDAQPLQAYWSLAIVSLTAATSTAFSYGEKSLGPLLFGDGATWQMGPLVFAPGEQPRIIASGGAPGSTVKGTLWGVQGTSFEDVSQLYSTAVLNFGQGSTQVTVVNGTFNPAVVVQSGSDLAPILDTIAPNATGPLHNLGTLATLQRISVSSSATAPIELVIGGSTFAYLEMDNTLQNNDFSFDGLVFPAISPAFAFKNDAGTTVTLRGYYIFS